MGLSSMRIGNESIWGYLNQLSAQPSQTTFQDFYSYLDSMATGTCWMIEERGGFSKILKMAAVPHPDNKAKEDEATIDTLMANLPKSGIARIEKIAIQHIQGVILYPVGDYDGTKCVVYHSPNGISVAEFLGQGLDPHSPVQRIFSRTKCPFILYDYSGTGRSKEVLNPCWSFKSRIQVYADDGYSVLNAAGNKFKQVQVWGPSFGGGVATVSTEAYLKNYPERASDISLYNHDSFRISTLWPASVQFLAKYTDHLDAETAMRSLAKRNVKMVVLCHGQDPLIPKEQRLVEVAKEQKVPFIETASCGHGNLSVDMLLQLK